MSCNSTTVVQDDRPFNVQQNPDSIVVTQPIMEIKVCSQNPMPNFSPFFLKATVDNQSVFELPVTAVLSIWVAINGILQSQVKTPTPDFMVSGNILTLSSGVDQGDTVFGMIQVG